MSIVRIFIQLFAILISAGILSSVGAQTLAELQNIYTTHSARYETDYEVVAKQTKADYLAGLVKLKKKFTDAGELPGVLAVSEALSNLESQESIENLYPVSDPPELAKFQREIVQQMAAHRKARQQKIKKLSESYLAKLKALQSAETKAGNIEVAKAVLEEVERFQAMHVPVPSPPAHSSETERTPAPSPASAARPSPILAPPSQPKPRPSPTIAPRNATTRSPVPTRSKIYSLGSQPKFPNESSMSLYAASSKPISEYPVDMSIINASVSEISQISKEVDRSAHFPRIQLTSRIKSKIYHLNVLINYYYKDPITGIWHFRFSERIMVPELNDTAIVIDARGHSRSRFGKELRSRHGRFWNGVHIVIKDNRNREVANVRTWRGATTGPSSTAKSRFSRPASNSSTSRPRSGLGGRSGGFRKF